MSALGIWNNRYEGGPCYAACMETFTLYLLPHLVTILPSSTAGEAATMEQAESTMPRAGKRPAKCARDTPPRPCGPSLANSNKLKISECIAKCFPQLHRIFTGRVLQGSGVKDTDVKFNHQLQPI